MDNISEFSRSYNAWKGMFNDYDEHQKQERVNARLDQISQAFNQSGGNMDAIPMELYSDRDGLTAMATFTSGMASNAAWRDQYMKSRMSEAQRSVQTFNTLMGDMEKSISDQDTSSFDDIVLNGIGSIGLPFQLKKNDDGETFTMTEWGDDGQPRIVDDAVTRTDIYNRVKAMGKDNRKLAADFTLARIQNDEWNLDQMMNGKSQYAVMKNGQVLQMVPQWITRNGRSAMGYRVVGGGDVTLEELEAQGLTGITNSDPRMAARGRGGYGLGGRRRSGSTSAGDETAATTGDTIQYEVNGTLYEANNYKLTKDGLKDLKDYFKNDPEGLGIAKKIFSLVGTAEDAASEVRMFAEQMGARALKERGEEVDSKKAYAEGIRMLRQDARPFLSVIVPKYSKAMGQSKQQGNDAKTPDVPEQDRPQRPSQGDYYTSLDPVERRRQEAVKDQQRGEGLRGRAVRATSGNPDARGFTGTALDYLSSETLTELNKVLDKNIGKGKDTSGMLTRGEADAFLLKHWDTQRVAQINGKNVEYWSNVYQTFISAFGQPPHAFGVKPKLAEDMLRDVGVDLKALNPHSNGNPAFGLTR